MSSLMQSLMTSYSKYFNLKYKHSGPLFESRYKAVRIDSEAYLEHISRYIHLNPRYWKRYPYSSLQYYFTAGEIGWLRPEKVEDLFENKALYLTFLEDYEDQKEILRRFTATPDDTWVLVQGQTRTAYGKLRHSSFRGFIDD